MYVQATMAGGLIGPGLGHLESAVPERLSQGKGMKTHDLRIEIGQHRQTSNDVSSDHLRERSKHDAWTASNRRSISALHTKPHEPIRDEFPCDGNGLPAGAA